MIGSIAQLIRAKKHTKNKPYELSVSGKNNQVVIINGDKNSLEFPVDLLPLFQEKVIDADLNKIAKPLQKDRVTKLEIRSGEQKDYLEAEINSEEREYFISESVEVVTSKEAFIDGLLESFNKETGRGTFRLPGGRGVPYHYTGENPSQFLADFGYPGLVKAFCTATFDSNLQPMRLDVQSVERIQRILPLN